MELRREIVGAEPVTSLESLTGWWNNPGIAAWTVVLFGCLLLNATLLFAFLLRPGLRTISNRFVMNLTVSNLLTCAVLSLLLMMDGPSAAESTSMEMTAASLGTTSSASSTTASSPAGNICAISEGTTALVTTASVLSVLLIAIDQYFAVVDPLRYRTRVDKLKSAVLIGSVWMVSAFFGLTASLNPSPRSLWLSCTTFDNSSFLEAALNASSLDSEFAFLDNDTFLVNERQISEEAAVPPPVISPTLLKTIESIKIDRSVGPLDNSNVIYHALTNDSVTYGLIYVIVHSLFAYLLPFAGVCWIYISIYWAAHRNSERTRRTGSRAILSSASFCEDPYGCARPPQQQQSIPEIFAEDFRKIPKISSLSSIDETSETTHSANQASRRRSFSSSSDAVQSNGLSAAKTSSGIVFTVGLRPVEVSESRELDRENNGTEGGGERGEASVEVLKTQFFEDMRGASSYGDLVSNNLVRDSRTNQRRKSSHDLMYEAVPLGDSAGWIAGGDSPSGSESEDERPYGRCFDSLKIPGNVHKDAIRASSDYFLSLASRCEEEEPRGDTERSDKQNVSEGTTRRVDGVEENSVVIKFSDYSTMGRVLIHDDNYLFQNSVANSVANKRPKRSSRRSSRSGILDEESVEPIGKNAENNANNGNADPSSCLLKPIVTITPASNKSGTLNRVPSVRSTSSSYINSLKHRISNGSLFRYREETRAARISALVIVMGLICWSPYVFLSVIKNLPQYSDYRFPHEYDVLALSFLILAAYVSPLLFGYRSKRVKRELRRFFCFRRELSYKNNRSLMAKKVLKRRHSSTLSHLELDYKYNIFNCVYGRSKLPKEKVQFVQVPDTALAVETCRSSFSSGASTQISSTSTEEC